MPRPSSKIVEIYRYRELLKNLVVNELRLRYRRSVLGFLWTILNPLLTMLVLTVVFSTIMRFNIKDYSVLLLAGLLPWIFLSQSVMLSLMSVIGKGALLKKVYIPKTIIPLSAVLASLINFLLSFIPLLLILLALGRGISETLLFLPVPILLLLVFSTGLAFIFSCVNVFFRDFTHMTEVLLQAWFYLSPVFYTLEQVPEAYRPIFRWNPLLYLIECFRAPIYHGVLPAAETLGTAAACALGTFVVGFLLFTRLEHQFVLKV